MTYYHICAGLSRPHVGRTCGAILSLWLFAQPSWLSAMGALKRHLGPCVSPRGCCMLPGLTRASLAIHTALSSCRIMPDMLAIDLFALQLRAIRYQPILGAILATRPPHTHLLYGGPPRPWREVGCYRAEEAVAACEIFAPGARS